MAHERARDRIFIEGLRARCVIGVLDAERIAPQEVLVDLEVGLDLRRAGGSDSLEETVDYAALAERVLGLAEGSSYLLAERLASAIAELCLGEPLVEWVRVRLAKPSALASARSVGVIVERRRGDLDPWAGPTGVE